MAVPSNAAFFISAATSKRFVFAFAHPRPRPANHPKARRDRCVPSRFLGLIPAGNPKGKSKPIRRRCPARHSLQHLNHQASNTCRFRKYVFLRPSRRKRRPDRILVGVARDHSRPTIDDQTRSYPLTVPTSASTKSARGGCVVQSITRPIHSTIPSVCKARIGWVTGRDRGCPSRRARPHLWMPCGFSSLRSAPRSTGESLRQRSTSKRRPRALAQTSASRPSDPPRRPKTSADARRTVA